VTPGLNEAAILGEFEDPAVIGGIAAMAIGNKNIAIGRNRHAGWPIEGIRAAPADAHLAKHHQHVAVLVELENLLSKNDARRIARRHAKYSLLVIDIADPQIALMVDHEPVRIDEHAGAEALEQLAGWIKLQDRRIGIAATETGGDARRHGVEAAMEDPNIAVAVDMHAYDLTPAAAIHALGQGRPALDKAIGIGQLSRLGVLRRLGVRSRCEARDEEHGGDERRSGSNRIRHSETFLQEALRFGSNLAPAGGMYAGFSSLGVRHISREARR